MSLVKEFYKLMHEEFEMSMMGDLTYFLGLQIKQLEEGNFVSQMKYCHELLKCFAMENSKVIDTPMPTAVNLDRDEYGKPVDVKRYRGIIGSLLYLTTSLSVKRILGYLYGTTKYGLWFSKGSDFSLVGYSDSDFAGCKLDRKNTSGTCHLFSNSLVS
ncbi:uncharacterized mitochondrial protein AtMg00810-like [Vicia villosa]|uniref:uncharacterized mitochondrial protein AtMg00810-like n=1 Tax=Vicia villosa TaxID=3911 RepID=UPI00273C69A0|nr:uncharacterized mitochondrial protein AtMg00810-like [Vicia villosa]